jgi:hypothetical protein
MPRDVVMTLRLGVFATRDGWLVAGPTQSERFDSWSAALRAALRRAQVARWRGAEVELLGQERPGGPLAVIERPRREPRR